MSVADQGSPAPSLRRPPFTVRLAPQLINRLLQQRDKPTAFDQVNGLLFGLNEEGVVIAQVHRGFEDGTHAGGSASRAIQDKLLEQQLSAAHKQPETSLLNLIGWYAVRTNGGLTAGDLAYHNWYFPHSHDLALILKPDGPSSVSLEIYCRTVSGQLNEEGHRVGLVRLSTSPLESTVEVVPRQKIQDEFFMRAYELIDPDEDKWQGWKGTLAVRYRKVFSFLRTGDGEAQTPEQKHSRIKDPPVSAMPPEPVSAPEISLQTTAPGDPFSSQSSVSALSNQRTGAPAAYNVRPIPADPDRRTFPWVPAALLFSFIAALTFGVLYYLQANQKLPGMPQPVTPQAILGLRVEAQSDRLLVSWNRQSALVQNAHDGVLTIEDSQRNRQLLLDSSQVMDGSVLYHPNSGDVSFRLEVRGNNGQHGMESIRVLEASKPEGLNLPQILPQPSPGISQNVPASKFNVSMPAADSSSLPDRPQDSGPRSDGVKSEPAAVPPVPELKSPVDHTADITKPKDASADDKAPPVVPGELLVRQSITPSQPEARLPEPVRMPAQQPVQQAKTPIWRSNSPVNPAIYQPPKPTRQVLPNMSFLPRGVIMQASHLEVLVKVDETGRVTGAQAVTDGGRVSPMLIGSAIAAARQWKFDPAMLRGRAVPSQHSIIFQFSGRQ